VQKLSPGLLRFSRNDGTGGLEAFYLAWYDPAMSTSLAIAIYFICWWIVLFAILPLQIGPQPHEGAQDPLADAAGAPYAPNLPRKFLITTIVSLGLFGVIYALIAFEVVTLGSLPFEGSVPK
jgi:predicted secreted protein